jgi:hypothetical protein
MSDTFSWGSDKDLADTVINANATELLLPRSATDADLALLAQRCKKLRTLNLSGCNQITDAGLMHLVGLQKLQRLDTLATAVTDAGEAAFRAAQQGRDGGASAAEQTSAADKAAAKPAASCCCIA